MSAASYGPADALLQAWEDWQAAMRALLEARPGEPEEAREIRFQRIDEAAHRIREQEVCELAGVVIRLRLVCSDWLENPRIEECLAYGRPVTEGMLPAARSRLLWSVLADVELMADADEALRVASIIHGEGP
jgi:hypothetical protein